MRGPERLLNLPSSDLVERPSVLSHEKFLFDSAVSWFEPAQRLLLRIQLASDAMLGVLL
jgi:hypothetical protein